MTAVASPYRQASASPLALREAALETELRDTREKLSGYANEEVRLAQLVPLGEAKESDLVAIRGSIAFLTANEARLARELDDVRAQIVASGERKVVSPAGAIDVARFPSAKFLIGCLLGGLAFAFAIDMAKNDTARDAPRGTTYEWGGPVARGQMWLYVEDPRGLGTSVDGQPAGSATRLEVSATASHVVGFAGGKTVVVRSIPCTTAVVRFDPKKGQPRVERFFNSSTCI
jgi:hypothetical protein